MIRRDSLNYTLLSLVLDLLVVVGSLALAQYMRLNLPFGLFEYGETSIQLPVYGIAALIWIIAAFALSVYDARRNYRTIDELQSVTLAILFSFLLVAGTLYFSYRDVSRLAIIYFGLLSLIFMIGWRVSLRLFMRINDKQGEYHIRRTLVIGCGDLGREVISKLTQTEWTGLKVVGCVDNHCQDTQIAGIPVLGNFETIKETIAEHKIEEVIITLPYSDYDNLPQIIADLQTLPLQVRIVPNYLNLALFRATVENVGGMPLINMRDPALTDYQRLTKRIFDFTVGGIALLMVMPVMALVALAIKLDSPGPIIFRQKRIGENGKTFTMYKFRSMYIDAEQRQKEALKTLKLHEINHKIPDDPRVTRIGRFIRRTSLDELPQLFNVLEGTMSLVGPRPELPYLVEKYEPWQRKRFAATPGITGWWQVNGRSDKPLHLSTEEDLYYLQNYSLLLDINIMWKTIAVVAKGKGAY